MGRHDACEIRQTGKGEQWVEVTPKQQSTAVLSMEILTLSVNGQSVIRSTVSAWSIVRSSTRDVEICKAT